VRLVLEATCACGSLFVWALQVTFRLTGKPYSKSRQAKSVARYRDTVDRRAKRNPR
jgi:hypothetical protein